MATDVTRRLVGFLAALVIIAVFTMVVGWSSILAASSRATPALLVAGSVIAFVGFSLVGLAWIIVIWRVVDYTLMESVSIFLATQFANAVTPLGQFGGEPFIAYLLSRDADLPIGESLGAVVAADLVNTVPFFTVSLFGVLLFVLQFSRTPAVIVIFVAVLALLIVTILVISLGLRFEDRAVRLARRSQRSIVRLSDRVGIGQHRGATTDDQAWGEKTRQFYAVGRGLLQDRTTLVTALVASHASSLVGVLGVYLLIASFGVEAPFAAVLIALPAAQVAGFLPLPGGLGGIEVAMAGLLALLGGVPLAAASAATLLYRVVTYWFGMVFLGGIAASRFPIDVLSS